MKHILPPPTTRSGWRVEKSEGRAINPVYAWPADIGYDDLDKEDVDAAIKATRAAIPSTVDHTFALRLVAKNGGIMRWDASDWSEFRRYAVITAVSFAGASILTLVLLSIYWTPAT